MPSTASRVVASSAICTLVQVFPMKGALGGLGEFTTGRHHRPASARTGSTRDARAAGTMVEIVAASPTPAPAGTDAAVSLVPPGKRFASSHGRTKRLNAAPDPLPTTTSSARSLHTATPH